MKKSGPQGPLKGQDRLERATTNGKLQAGNPTAAGDGPVDYTAGLPTKRMAAAILFFDPEDRLLLVEPAYTKIHWELPGGIIEANESPRAAAIREIHEELGLTIARVASWRSTGYRHVPPEPKDSCSCSTEAYSRRRRSPQSGSRRTNCGVGPGQPGAGD